MAITTLDDWIAAPKQRVQLMRASRAAVAAQWFGVFDLAGAPGAGTLAAGNTANGLVPDDTVNGYPRLNAFDVGATGYLSRVEFSSTVACRIALFDRLFVAGAFSFNANVALASQPSFAGRLPDGYGSLEIWVEQVTAGTGNQAVSVTYLDQDGNSASTGAVGIGAAPTVGRCWQLPLAAGDSGVQRIDNVVGSVASAGTFNVMVLRRLADMRVRSANDGGALGLADTMVKLYDTSALYMLVAPDSTATGVPDLLIEVANK